MSPPEITSSYEQTARTRVRRGLKRATYDRATVHDALDTAMFCTVATIKDWGPRAQPFSHWRVGDEVFIHGSSRNGLFAALKSGAEACLSVTVLDGLVWARSAMHHSVNYRSVVAYGRCRVVEGDVEKTKALQAMLEKYAPGRWAHIRPPSAKELKAVEVLALPLREVSAKVRAAPPIDDAGDYSRPVWAGVVPIHMIQGEPEEDLNQGPPA